MKRFIEWVKSSNHYLHIALLAAISLMIVSVESFEFGVDGLWTNVLQCVKFGFLTGISIEAYQAIVSKSIDIKNTLGDIIADVIGLVLGIGFYLILVEFASTMSITLCLVSFASIVLSIIDANMRYYLLIVTLCCTIVSTSLFIYA